MANERIPNITIENAKVIFKNFSGKESRFNRAGTRNFSVVIGNDWAQTLKADGWNVKALRQRNPDDPIEYALPVSVRFDNYPPKIVMVSSNGQTPVDETTVGMLDFIDIKNIDLIVSPSRYDFNGNQGIKAYLKTMYVTLEENELDKKYGYQPGVSVAEEDASLPF